MKQESVQKAKFAVRTTAEFFRNSGFRVTGDNKHVNANGTDLVISKNGQERNLEVKCVFRAKGSWKVNRSVRIHDDLVAIVFPNGRVHIETIETFRLLRPLKGARAVTDLVWAYDSNEEAMADIKRMAILEEGK